MNDNVKTELNVGDIIYRVGVGANDISRSIISRVTATMAIVERKSDGMTLMKFTRPWNGGSLRKISCDQFSSYSYYLATPDLDAQHHRAYLIRSFAKIDGNKLSDEQLKSIINIGACEIGTASHSLVNNVNNVNMLTARM
jgi:hypothetical protein